MTYPVILSVWRMRVSSCASAAASSPCCRSGQNTSSSRPTPHLYIVQYIKDNLSIKLLKIPLLRAEVRATTPAIADQLHACTHKGQTVHKTERRVLLRRAKVQGTTLAPADQLHTCRLYTVQWHIKDKLSIKVQRKITLLRAEVLATTPAPETQLHTCRH